MNRRRKTPAPRSVLTVRDGEFRSHLQRIARRLNKDMEKHQLLVNPSFRRFSERGSEEYAEKFEARHSAIATGPRGAASGGTRPLGPTALLNALLALGRQKKMTVRTMRAEQKSNSALKGREVALTRFRDQKQKRLELARGDFKLINGRLTKAPRLRDHRVVDMQKLLDKKKEKNVYPLRSRTSEPRKVAERSDDDLRR